MRRQNPVAAAARYFPGHVEGTRMPTQLVGHKVVNVLHCLVHFRTDGTRVFLKNIIVG